MPTREHVRKAMEVMKTGADYDYFFERLNSPDWIQPLLEEGVLSKPPPPRAEGSGTWYPLWSASKYLARMASRVPEAVAAAIRDVPDTGNVRVHEDFVDAALNMPPEIASRVVDLASAWIRSGPSFLLPQKLGQLVVHMAQGGEIDAAFGLASSLLALKPTERIALLDEDDIFDSTNAEALFDAWDYGEILRAVQPALSDVDPERALQLLMNLLDQALFIASGLDAPPSGPTEDLSYVWRPAIEDHEQNWRGDAKDHLVVAVRDAASKLIEGDPSLVTSLVPSLLSQPWRVYHRVAIHLLNRFSMSAPDLVRNVLTNADLFDELGVRHEFALLMQGHFGHLEPSDQDAVLHLVDSFDVDDFRRRYETAGETEPTDQEVRKYEAFRRRDRLWLIGRELLPPDRQSELDGLLAQLGSPDRPADEMGFSRSWVGPTSPMEVDELAMMSVADAVAHLREWQPSGDQMAPTPEGLGRVLSAVVAEAPDRYAQEAMLFQDVDPTYVRGLISGLREGLRQKKEFDWGPVVDLCVWVAEQPRAIARRTGDYMDLDPGWVWTRKEIAALFSDGFSRGDSGPAPTLRERCWAALEPLTKDPEPDADYERQYGGENMDPSHLSINTVRGQAMHATVSYLLWVRRAFLEDGQEFGFQHAPEAVAVLEDHLDVTVDPSLTVRSVYGWHFPRLHLLDKEWAVSMAERIFPTGNEFRAHFEAAWDAYVLFNPAYNDVAETLAEPYRVATSRISSSESREARMHDADEHLTDHLMSLYWRGEEQLGEDTLIEAFYASAPVRLRKHALVFLGRSLIDAPEMTDEVRARLTQLWASRLELVDEESSDELSGFGWWFASRHLDGEWLLEQLEQVLRRAKGVDPRHLVAERLVQLVGDHPGRVVECLRLFIEASDKPWDVYGIREEAMTILKCAMASGDETLIELARGVIHSLGARGYREFRQLLPANGTAPVRGTDSMSSGG